MTQIIIRYNKILDEITKAHSLTLPKHAERASQDTDMDEVNKKIKQYIEAGSPIKDRVIEAIEKMTKRPFPYSVVNVSIVWIVYRTEAQTMIFPASLSVDEFIILLTHELMHLSWPLYTVEFEEKYKDEKPIVRDHIIIHATLQHLWCDILNRPDYLEISRARSNRHSTDEYTKAWEIIDKEGCRKVLNYIKEPIKYINEISYTTR